MGENKPNNIPEENKPNNNEQQLNTPSTDETIVTTAVRITELEQPSNSNLSTEALAEADLQPLNPDMEVHHHAHDPAAPHHKKNWKSYFWEFLMLFLAVFCGFLAEYQLEHKIESDRVREYAISLVQDLQNDTTAINDQIRTGEIYVSSVDSLFKFSKTKLEGTNAVKFSFYTRFMYWTGPLTWNRATFEQIKNSGNLRYIKNHQLLQRLMKYNALIDAYEGEYENRMVRGNMMLTQINQVIDPQFHQDISGYRLLMLDTMSVTTNAYISRNIPSLEPRRAPINEMLNMAAVQQRNLVFINNSGLKPAKELAKELIGDLKKEYHLQ